MAEFANPAPDDDNRPGGPTGGPIYLDYNATTPVDRRVAAAAQPFWAAEFGNPPAITATAGVRGRRSSGRGSNSPR